MVYIFLRDLAFHTPHNLQNVDEEGSKFDYQPICRVSIAYWLLECSTHHLYSIDQQLEPDGISHGTMDIFFDLVRQ